MLTIAFINNYNKISNIGYGKKKKKKICVKERTLLHRVVFMFDLSRFSLFLSLSDKHTQITHSELFKQHRLPLFHQKSSQNLRYYKRKKKWPSFQMTCSMTTLKQWPIIWTDIVLIASFSR